MSKFIKIECLIQYPNSHSENYRNEIVIVNIDNIQFITEKNGHAVIHINYPERKVLTATVNLEKIWTEYLSV
ncbi:hypothetical protein HMPREF2532_00108 [Bacteroides ovatus]|nr:hypothetical protein HMPREF2532_00108 [Bacteroides ovatus]